MKLNLSSLRISVFAMLLCCAPIAQSADLRIAYNAQWYPYSYGDTDQVQGILVDLLDHILGKRLGYELEHNGFPWSRVQHYVEAGDQDAFFTFPSAQRLEYSRRAEADVFNVESRAFVRDGSAVAQSLASNQDLKQIDDLRVCVMLGDNWSQNFFNERGIAFDYGRDTRNCLEQVAFDRVDLFIHATATSQANLHQADLQDKVAMLPEVYSSIPLTLLLSKESQLPQELLNRFNAEVAKMAQDGSLAVLIENLRGKPWPAPPAE